MAITINDDLGSGTTDDKNVEKDRIQIDSVLGTSNTDNVQAGFNNPKSKAPSLTFGSRTLNIMSTGMGSEYLNKTTEAIKKIIELEIKPGGFKLDITSIDKEIITNLAYSCIVLSLHKANKTTYFIIVLEATGRKPLDVTTIVNEMNNAERINNYNRVNDFYVTSDAVDATLHNEVMRKIKPLYSEKTTYTSVEALIVPYKFEDITPESVKPIVAIAFNACLVELAKLNGEFNDLDIKKTVSLNPTSHLKIDSNMIPRTLKDIVNKPIRADWTLDLVSIDTKQNVQSPNLQNNRTPVSRATGFIDAMPKETVAPNQQGIPVNTTRLSPNIIINSLEVDMPTTGYALIALVSSVVMVRPNMWLAAVAPKSTDTLHDPGMLNLFTNLDNSPSGIGSPIDFKDPKLTHEDMYRLIKDMYSQDPVLSLDIEVQGSQTSYLSVFAMAASPEDPKARFNAGKDIIKSANWITSGAFPENFDPGQIFASDAIVVPTGTWIDKNGESRDIREIDFSLIGTLAASDIKIDLMNKWALSNVPLAISGVDSYTTKLNVISKLIDNAEITGKAIRCTFNPVFLSTLAAACAQVGFDTKYDPEVSYSEQSNIAVIGNYLANAGIGQDVAGFAKAYTTNGMSYQTPFAMHSMNRF